MQTVPKALKRWFIVHFVADIIFAIPLIIAPVAFLQLLGWTSIDPITARLVGAALIGIGTESLLARHSSVESYKTMLQLKIIWSSAAVAGIALSIWQMGEETPLFAWVILGIFICFNFLWGYWRKKLQR